jgi:hypothetical protein
MSINVFQDKFQCNISVFVIETSDLCEYALGTADILTI